MNKIIKTKHRYDEVAEKRLQFLESWSMNDEKYFNAKCKFEVTGKKLYEKRMNQFYERRQEMNRLYQESTEMLKNAEIDPNAVCDCYDCTEERNGTLGKLI